MPGHLRSNAVYRCKNVVLKHNLKFVRDYNSLLCENVMDIICNIHRNLLLLCLKSPNTSKMKCREIAVIIRSMQAAHSPFNKMSLTNESIAPCN